MNEVIYICKQNLCFLPMLQVLCYLYCAAKCGHRKKSIYLPAYLEIVLRRRCCSSASVAHVCIRDLPTCTLGAGKERESSLSLSPCSLQTHSISHGWWKYRQATWCNLALFRGRNGEEMKRGRNRSVSQESSHSFMSELYKLNNSLWAVTEYLPADTRSGYRVPLVKMFGHPWVSN